uniref:Ig-like domain-containing protein n=1 Tax=Catharus ustulatus TaxID=91951 RepID=A0A8C3TQF0_CATUS
RALRMLLLPLLALAATWSHGQAQVLLKQREVSITRGNKTRASMDCIAEGVPAFQYAYIHWYRHVPNKAPEWILYIGDGAASYDGNSYRNKYSSSKKGTNVCTLTINDINSSDEGAYYCAYWHFHRTLGGHLVFCSGTELVVSGKVLHSLKFLKTTYVCLIEKFYPEVIRVKWTDDEKEVTDNVVKGDTWQSTKEDKYSIASWLTVPAENEEKNYYCKYEHEEEKASLNYQKFSQEK